MRKLLLQGVMLLVAGSLVYTPAHTQDSIATKKEIAATEAPKVRRRSKPRSSDGRPVSTRSTAFRTNLCRADCSPKKYDQKSGVGIHGIYRSYHTTDPNLVSVEGKQQYAECVSKCLAPLPTVYVQRAVFGMGINWFGKSKQSCLDCHIKGH